MNAGSPSGSAAPPTPGNAPAAPAAAVESARLADQLERSVRGGAWHGPALLPALEGIAAGEALARPIAGAHTIHELVWHSAFWIEAARERILDLPAEPLRPESDWPAAGEATPEGWQDALARLEGALRGLHGVLHGLPDARLDDPVSGSDPTVRGLLLGLVQHNAYHAGQIVLLRRAAAGAAR